MARPSAAKRSKPTALGLLAPGEQAQVLHALIAAHPDLGAQAEQLAAELLRSVAIEQVASDVEAALVGIPLDALATITSQAWSDDVPNWQSGRMEISAHEAPADEHADLQARVDAAAALNRLGHALVGHRADATVLRTIAHATQQLAEQIEQEPLRERGSEVGGSPRFLQAVTERRPLGEVVEDGAFLDMFEDSPVSGSANPLSIGLKIRQDGDEAVGIVTLDRGWEGAPGRSHGGIVASCVDETLGGLLPVISEMAFTGELSLKYVGPCPMGVPLEFRAWLERREGRKLHLGCTGSAEGEVFVRAAALFITVDLERFRPKG